ncbi:MAG: polyprenyl synthetase family protein, partial [Bacteroidales bacterium]|nr:polyprenyl synthetase family protein [Bacteroidales bacterium]
AGIELIHCFSLVHDDLPCMDNDDYRRGKLTNHKVFGEAVAVLTGDALLVLGLEYIRQNVEVEGVSKESVVKAIQKILEMLGTHKMLGGQIDDINWQLQRQSEDKITDIYLKKTSALICAALEIGGLLAQADAGELSALHSFGEKIGLAFQITDDMLDFEKDKKSPDKPSYPATFGIEKSLIEIKRYCREAKESLSIFGNEARYFLELVDFVRYREE